MISLIRGEIVGLGQDNLVVYVGGVGLQVYVPKITRAQAHLGDTIFLYTYLLVREDLLNLYGFETESERDFFVLLLGVNGVGPRVSLSILSTLTLDVMRQAVLSEQADVFSRVSGVGKKTAQKIILHLQDRITGDMPVGIIPVLDVDSEVMDALVGLGYSVIEAQTAIQSIPRDASKDVESRLLLALKFFNR